MSKSKGNIVNPDEYISVYGSDAIRMYLAFLAPLTQGGDFRDEGIKGITRFLGRVWKFFDESPNAGESHEAIKRAAHRAIKKVTEDIEAFQYNTAISSLMILLNEFERKPKEVSRVEKKIFLQLLAPFAPHITEELWTKFNETSSIHRSKWPEFDPKLIEEGIFELVVQINGKVRGKITLPRDAGEEEAKAAVLKDERMKTVVSAHPKKIVFVRDRLINFVQ